MFLKKLKYRFFKKKSQVVDAGHGKITLLIIPHFEHKVFRIQVSPFLLLFFCAFFLVMIGFSVFSISHSGKVEEQKSQLTSNKSQDEILIDKFLSSFENITVRLNQILPELEKAHFLINRIPIDLRSLEKTELQYTSMDGLLSNEHDKSIENLYPGKGIERFDITENMPISTLAYKLEFILRNFKAIHGFVNAVEDVLYHIPSSWPVTGGFITSLWGVRYNPFNEQRDMHFGIDIAHAVGIPIRATAPGVVVSSTFSGRYGNVVSIRHKYGYYTIYAHNHENRVRAGEKVYRGKIIAEVGQTGYATGPHLHYSIMVGKDNINPYSYLMIH